jgi:hypothetical protein
MRFSLALFALALACGSSSSKSTEPSEPAPVPPPATAEPAAPPQPAPPPALPPIPEAPPPAKPGAPRPYVAKAMAYLPADTQVLIGIDVPRIASTPLGDKLREALVGAQMPAPCASLDATKFGNVVFAANGSGKVVVVFDGKIAERAMVACADAAVKAKDAKLETKNLGGRKVYYVSGGPQDNGWITWTKTGIIMASSEAALTEALAPKSPKLGGDLAALSMQVDHARMVWGVSTVPVAALAALGVAADKITGSLAVRGSIDIAAETDVDVVIGLATPGEAAAMGDVVRALLAPLRSAPNVAPLLAGLRLGVHGNDVHLMARLDADVTRKLIEAVNVK